MSRSQGSRGPHPQDCRLFAPGVWPTLRKAVRDLSWLRTRGYAENSSVKLVGDRYRLTARQRVAVARCSCGDAALAARRDREIELKEGKGKVLLVDGFNVLITIEAALAGGVLLRGRDGCIRDMSSMHGNYRVLDNTEAAVKLVLESIATNGFSKTIWYLDSPVSNSGRLRTLIEKIATSFPEVSLEVRLVKDPDPVLKRSADRGIVATADSGILDACGAWTNLVGHVLGRMGPGHDVIDFDEA